MKLGKQAFFSLKVLEQWNYCFLNIKNCEQTFWIYFSILPCNPNHLNSTVQSLYAHITGVVVSFQFGRNLPRPVFFDKNFVGSSSSL